jgi:adenine-specific DNA-methyltransferase
MSEAHRIVHTTRGVQLALIAPTRPSGPAAVEPKGVVYTKKWVVELLLDLAGYTPDRNLVDAVAVEPAAGAGAFLGPMIERLADSCSLLGRSLADCRNSLIAYELEESSADRARSLAAGILIRRGVEASAAEQLARSWVRCGDYLLEAPNTRVDYVLGNPPYIRLEDIPPEICSFYRQAYPTMIGRADLYIAFFEAGLQQLNSNGTCAFICADRWMRNQYGAELRELVTSSYAVEVVVEMHTADAFQGNVDAYPAIVVIRRKPQASAVIASICAGVSNVAPETLSEILRSTRLGKHSVLPHGLRAATVEKWFRGKDPWPCHSPEQLALLRNLEDRFPTIESNAKIGIGVATGNDALFITRDPHLVEPSRLLKLALVGDILSGVLEWSGHYLINPWDNNGLVRLEDYPRLKAYLEQHASSLKKRHTALKNRQGWYKTIDRVTHGLTNKLKLYIPDIKNAFAPVLDPGKTYPHHNLYFIESTKWDLEVLGGLLMSVVGQFFVESYGVRMRGGYLRFQAQYLRRIRVPDPQAISPSQANELVKAFRERDRERATGVALEVYGIDRSLMERALER